jgi:hypothetical protein
MMLLLWSSSVLHCFRSRSHNSSDEIPLPLCEVPFVTHACRKRRLKCVATLPLGDINTEAWSSGMGVGLTTLPCKKNCWVASKNTAGFWGGGQGLRWAVEPRKEEEDEECIHVVYHNLLSHGGTTVTLNEIRISNVMTRNGVRQYSIFIVMWAINKLIRTLKTQWIALFACSCIQTA